MDLRFSQNERSKWFKNNEKEGNIDIKQIKEKIETKCFKMVKWKLLVKQTNLTSNYPSNVMWLSQTDFSAESRGNKIKLDI